MRISRIKNQISCYQRKANFEVNQLKESKANFNVEEKNEDNRIADPKWFLTDADSSGKRNWIEEYEVRIKRDKKISNFVGLKHKQEVLKVLRRLT